MLGKSLTELETHVPLNRRIVKEKIDVWDNREKGLNMERERQQLQVVGATGKAEED